METQTIIFLVSFFLLFASLILFDRILWIQKKEYEVVWKKDGRIIGFFSFNVSITNSINRFAKMLSWTFSNDEWMKVEATILRQTLIMRLCVFSFWILWLIQMLFIFRK